MNLPLHRKNHMTEHPSSQKPSYIKYLPTLKNILTLVLLGVIIHKLNWHDLKHTLSSTNLLPLIAALLTSLFVLVLQALLQGVLFKGFGIHIPWLSAYAITLKSVFYSFLLPGDLAAGTSRVINFTQIAKQHPDNPKDTLFPIVSVIALERVLGLVALVTLLSILLFIIPLPLYHHAIHKISLIMLSLAIGIYALLSVGWIKRKLAHKVPVANTSMLKRLLSLPTYVIRLPFKTLLLAGTLALLSQFISVSLAEYWITQAIGIDIPFIDLVAIACVVRFLRSLPITPAGIGVREGLYPLFLKFYGVSYASAVVLGGMGTLITLVIGGIGGLIDLSQTLLKKKKRHAC